MKIFCTDGTTVDCAAFRALDSGILVFDEEPEDDEAHQEATGFVPLAQLKYVLPDDVQPGQQVAPGMARATNAPGSPGFGGQTQGSGQPGGAGIQQTPGGGAGQRGGPGGSPPEGERRR